MSWLVEPWTWGAFMARGALAATLVAVPCAVLGVFLYLRRMSMLGDALAHIALPGILVAWMISGGMHPMAMLAGAVGVGLLSTWAIEAVSRRARVRNDAAIGIVFTAFFAAGVIAVSTVARDVHIDAECVLFGDLLAISDTTLTTLGILAPASLALVALGWRWLSVSSFDARFAAAVGVPVVAVHYALTTTVTAVAVAGFEAVGAILPIALLVLPAATAHALTHRLSTMVAVAVVHALVASFGGLYLAVWFDVTPAGAIAVVGGGLYALARVAMNAGALTLATGSTRSTDRVDAGRTVA